MVQRGRLSSFRSCSGLVDKGLAFGSIDPRDHTSFEKRVVAQT